MNLKYITLFLLIIFITPFAFAELQPAFLDQNTHYFGEKINFGLIGVIPDDFNHARIIVQLPTGHSYQEADIDIDNLSDYYLVFPLDFIYNQLQIKYIFYNSNNTAPLNTEYTLQLERLPLIENINYCINADCNKNNFEVIDANEIYLKTQTEIIDENLNFDILVILDGYIIEDGRNIQLPYLLDTTPGEYEIKVTPNYNNQELETKSLFLNLAITQPETNNLEDYLNDIREQNEAEEREQEINTAIENINDSQTTETQEKTEPKNNLWLIGLGILVVLIILISILLFSRPKEKFVEKPSRRESRKERGFLFLIIFVLLFSSIYGLSLEEKIKEYQNLEITFDTLQKSYPYPKDISIPISNTQPQNVFYYPISATGLSDAEKITPIAENKLSNLIVSLETVYLSIDLSAEIETAKTTGKTLGFESGCEQVLEWFQKNPITAEPNTIIARTKENLLNNITITENKTGYTDNDKTQIRDKIKKLKTDKKYKNSKNPFVEYCISDYLENKESNIGGKYITKKKILLKMEYTEKNLEAINNYDLTFDNIIFNDSKGKDVLETTFLGSDLNHIYVWVDYTADILREQNLSLKGIAANRILQEEIADNGEIIKHYMITNLDEGESVDVTYAAQLINLEILDSDYGSYYQFEGVGQDTSATPEKKGNVFAIRDKDLFSVKNKILSNVEISGKISLENGNYKFELSPESIKLLAEVNINPTKYIVLDKKQLIDVGTDTQKLTIGIDYNYGIICSDFSGITILLEEDKTLYLPTNINNPHLEALTKLFIKTSSQKNIELTRLQLPLLFIFAFKNNANTIPDEDVLFLKTYDDVANIINRGNYTKLEKNIIFNNLISLTEDFSFQKTANSKDGLYRFKYKTRFVLNYGLVNYIDHPENINNLNLETVGITIPQLYDNKYLERKGFVDKSLTTLLVLGYLGDNYRSFSKVIRSSYNSHEEYEIDLKNQIQTVFNEQKATTDNWGYYKELLIYPFYRTGIEQKICSYDKENFPKYSVKNYCYQAYNFNPESNTWGIAYDPHNLDSGFLMQDYSFQNNFVSSYRTILLLEDIENFKNNKLTFNQNQLKTYNKLNIFLSLIELEAIRNTSTTENNRNFGNALILSYKLRELWDSSSNELKKYDSGTIRNAIINTNEALAYQATVKLRNVVSTDKSLRLDIYKGLIQTDFERYAESINPSAGWFDLSDSARFLITGSWIETFIFTGSRKEIESLDQKERDKYNKILHGSCCIAQRLGELESDSSYKNWTIKDIKDNFSPYSKAKTNTKTDVIGWVTDGTSCTGTLRANPGDCATDISYLYNSKEFGNDISFILNDKKDKKSITQFLSAGYYTNHTLDMDSSIQVNSTKRELEETKVKFKPDAITSALRFIDSGINPATIIITVATAGAGYGLMTGTGSVFTRIASGFTTKLTLGKLSSALGTRLLYEFGENIVLDAAYGAIVIPSPKLAGEHPFLTYVVLGVIAGNFQKAFISNVDNAASAITKDLIATSGLKQADNIKIQTAIKTALNTDYSDTTEQLLKIKRGEAVTDSFFRRLPKVVAGTADDELVTAIRKNLLSQKISVSDDVIRKSLTQNNLYLGTRASAVSKFISRKNLIELNNIAAANLDNTSSKFIKLATTRTVPERYGAKFTSIVDEFEDLKKFNEIDPEHFAKPTKIVYDDFGNPLGYEMEKIYGTTLADYIEDGGVLDDSFYKRIEDSVSELHKQGYAHGDINPNNIILRETYDGLDFTIIDPVGFRKLNQITDIPGLTEQAAIDLDIEQLNKLRNLTILEAEMMRTNKIYVPNVWELQRIQQTGELVPIRREGGNIVLGEVLEISSDNTKVKVRFSDYLNNVTDERFYDIDTETFIPIRQNDIVYVNGVGSGKVITVEPNKTVTLRRTDGSIIYTDVDAIISSRSLNQGLKLNGDISQITPQTTEAFSATKNRLPERFISRNTDSWSGREVILVDKINDPVLKEYLANVRILSSQNPDILNKIKEAYNLVNRTMPVYSLGKTNILDDIIDNVDVGGDVIPLGHFINSKIGVCRHKALLLKLTLDEMGIESYLVRGSQYTDEGKNLGRHVWVEMDLKTNKGNKIYLDPTQNKYEYFYDGQQVNGLVRDSELTLFRIRDTVPQNNFRNLADGADIYKRTARLQNYLTEELHNYNLNPTAINDFTFKYNITQQITNPQFLSQIGSNLNDLQDLMKLQNLKIKEIYQNDGLLLTLNHKLSLSSLPTNVREEIVSELGRKNVSVIVVDDWTIRNLDDQDNFATLNLNDPRNPIIKIERSAYNDPNKFLREMRYEYGALLLSKQYGSKGDIPLFFKPSDAGKIEPVWATHYLDHYMEKGYNRLFPN
ncbi:MAG TPA: hypothetical protein PLK55_03550 [archaeon]|nr:hypothetical protein [archaeon]